MSSEPTPEAHEARTGSLERVLGRLEATTIVVGSMIGSGIFLKASGMMQILPHPTWLLGCWAAAGLLTVSGALVIAELSARFPGSGGLYVFLREAFGPMPAYLFGWSLFAILQSGSIAGLATGLAKVLAEAYSLSGDQRQAIAFVSIGGLTIVHCLSVSVGAKWVQNSLTFIKYMGLVMLIAMGFFGGQAHGEYFRATQPLPATGPLIAALGLVMLKALWAYDGWANATFIAGEVREAEKNLPLALLTGTVLVVLAYLLTNATYHLVLSPEALPKLDAPAVAVASQVMGAKFARLTSLLLALSMFGTLNSSILSAPRVYFAMARAGQFPAFMGSVNRFHTPYLALLLQGGWAAFLVCLWGSFETITDNVIFIYWMFYALTVLAALRFPPPDSGYRAPGRTLLATVFLLGAALVVGSQLIQQPHSALQALGLLALGVPYYLWSAGRPSSDSSPSLDSDAK